MKATSIEVAGESPVLSWLVTASQQQAPWLRISPKQWHINWEMFLECCSGGKAPVSPALSKLLSLLLPTWPLERFLENGEGARSRGYHSNRPIAVVEQGEAFALGEDLSLALRTVIASLDELNLALEAVQRRSSSSAHEGRILRETRHLIQQCLAYRGIKWLRQDIRVGYCLEQRLTVSRGDMVSFLRGTPQSNGSSAASKKSSHETSWALAHRLVRSHWDCYLQLEQLVSAGIPSQPWSELSLAESIKGMARQERSLVQALTQGEEMNKEWRQENFSRFATCGRALLGLEKKSDTGRAGAGFLGTTPFNRLIELLEKILECFDSLKYCFDARYFEVLSQRVGETIRRTLAVAGAAARKTALQDREEEVTPQVLEEAIDQLIAETPLLTLLTSGFLSFYCSTPKSAMQQGGPLVLGFSPWLVSSIMAKKTLGTLPMSYLGREIFQEASEGNELSQEGNMKMLGSEVQLTGRSLWDCIQGNSLGRE